MFDAAAAATASEVNQEQVAQEQAEAAVSSEGNGGEPTAAETESQELLQAITSYNPGESTTEIVFVDPTVPNYQELLSGMDLNIEVIMLDGSRDGIEQIAEALAGRNNIDAIHLISHGDAGMLQLGTGTLNTETMSGQYADELAIIQQALSEQADILVYGCDFAKGETGQAAATRLAELTGADIAASTDDTGQADLGGDWDLEFETGLIQTHIVIVPTIQENWNGLLDISLLNATQDTYIKLKSPDNVNNFGDSTSLMVDRESTDLQRALLQFDLSSIPAGSTINSATLKLQSTQIGGTLNISVYEVTESWSEGSGTGTAGAANWNERAAGTNWTTAGGTYDPTAVANLNTNATGQHTWNITSLVQAWFSGTKTNNGLMVASPDGGGNRTVTYDSSEGATVPVLEINYTPPPNVAPTITSLSGDSLAYAEGDGAVVIEQGGNALVADVDSSNLDTGTLTVSIPSGGDSAEDVLSIRNQGTGAGQIGVSGSNVTYQGVTIGTFTGGSSGSNLVITLNSSATPTAVTALVKNITYQNTDTNAPTTGARTVRYVLTDGDGGTSANYDTTVTVSGVNDAPVLDSSGTMTLTTITEDQTTNSGNTVASIIASAGGDRITDVDTGAVEGIAITALNSGNGTWQYSTNGGGTWANIGSVTNTSALLLRSTDLVRFVPDGQNATSADFTFRAWDQTSGTVGTKIDVSTNGGTTAFSSTTETASITVTAVNDAPYMPGVALGSTNEDATKTWQVSTFAGYSSDADTGALKGLAIVGVDNTNGTWQYTLDSTNWVDIDSGASASNALLLAADATSAFRFVPNANWNGTTGMLQYKAWDQTSGTAGSYVDASVSGGTTAFSGTSGSTLTVTAVNDAPTITSLSGDSLAYNEGAGAVVIEQGANAVVADVDSTDFNSGTLIVSFTAGSDSAEDVLAIRNQGTSAGQIGISGSNITYGGTIIGTYTGGSGGSNLVITLNSNATPTAVTALVQNITYENTDTGAPTTGARTVRYILTDGDGGTSANYDTTVTVSAVNDMPVNTVPGAQTVAEDTPLSLSGVSVNDVDGNLSTVELGVVNGTVSVTLQGGATISAGNNASNTLTLSGSEADINATLATLVYQGSLNYNGADTLTVTSTDANSGTDVDTVAITVTAVNDATLITGGTSGSGAEDTVLTGTLTATDAEGLSDGTVFTVSTNATHGVASIDPATGLWSYTPTADYNGSDSFTVTITDDAGNTATQVISVTVTPVVDLTDDSLTTAEDTAISANVLTGTNGATADSFEGTPVLTGVTQGAHGSVTFLADGTVTYTPNANFTGPDSFTYSITSGGVTETATVTVTVTAVNDAPTVAVNTGSTVAEGGTDTISSSELAVTDVEQVTAQFTYSIGTGPAYGRLELTTVPGVAVTSFTQADIDLNRLVYVHDGSETTSDNFTFTVSDGAGGLLGATTMTLTITPVNDAPTIISNGGGPTTSINVVENVSAVTIVTGADVDLPAQTLTYSISGGVDQARFTINAATGALNFTAPPDFEVATDANGDNVYVVQVEVIDSQGASTTQTIQVTVTDVAEALPHSPTTPAIAPVLLPTTPTPPTSGDPTPSSLSSPSEPPADPPPPASVVPSPRATPSDFQPVNVDPPSTDSLAERIIALSDELKKLVEIARDQAGFIPHDDTRRSVFTVLPVEPVPVLDPDPVPKQQSTSDLLLAKLSEMAGSLEQAIGASEEHHELVTRVAALTGTTLSIGFIVWALRSGALLASFMATMPAWRHFDPLPVLGGTRSEWERRRKDNERDQQAEAAEYRGLKKLLG